MRLSCLLLITLVSVTGAAQDPGFTNYSTNNRLGSQITDMHEDELGNLWSIGLLGQFFSFDGDQTRTFTFSPEIFTNNIFRIAAIRDKILFLTDRGLISFDGVKFNVTPLINSKVVDNRSQLTIDKHDRAWVIDQNGLVAYTGAYNFSVLDNKEFGKAVAITNDTARNIFILWSTGAVELVDENLNRHRVALELSPLQREWKAMDIFGQQIILATNDSVFVFNNNKLSRTIGIREKLGIVQQVLADDAGSHWIVKGEKLFRIGDGNQVRIDESRGLTNNRVARIFRDRSKNIWILTDGKGTFKAATQMFRQFSIDDESTVSSVLNLNDTATMLGTYGKGLFIMEGSRRPVKIETNSQVDHSIVTSQVKLSTNRYLIATHGNGLYELTMSPGRPVVTRPAQPEEIKFVRSMTVRGDSIIVATREGVFLKISRNWQNLTRPFREKNFTVNCFRPLSKDEMLIGSAKEGLVHYKKGTFFPIDTAFLKSTAVNTIQRDGRGNFWIGTNRKEILILDRDLKVLKRLVLPLQYEGVFLIQFVDENDLVLGVGGVAGNLVRATITDDFKVTDIVTYAASHGWPDPALVLGAFTKYNNRYLWIGTMSGAFRLDLSQEVKGTAPPNAYFTSIEVLNSSTSILDYSTAPNGIFQVPKDTRLPHAINSIKFSFKANDIASPRSLKYRFLMKGISDAWSQWTSQTDVIFSNLKPGTYSLNVQAMNDRGATGPPAEFAFVIAPAFWQTVWFYVAVAVVLAILLVISNHIYYKFRLKKYLREERLKREEAARIKQQMSMDFHDELGNKLAGVMSYSSALRLTTNNPELSSALEYIENSAQEIFYRTKDFIWAIDVQSNNLLEVLIYLRDFGVRFFERRKIEFNVSSSLEQAVFDKALADGDNRQIILIFKEAMTNIFKHSSASKVELRATVEKDNIAIISIEDDGHGHLNLLTPGHGLRNMRRRAESMKAALEFEKSALGGLKVRLEFKFNNNQFLHHEKL